MLNKLTRRIVKAVLFTFLFGFILVLEKTNRAASLQDLGVENAFSVAQPIYSWILGFPLLIFLIYSKWADKNIWIRSDRKDIINPRSNVNSNENSIKRMETIDKEKCQCGSIIQDKAKFCSECGLEIMRKPKIEICECGEKINPKAKYCENCGLKIIKNTTEKIAKQNNEQIIVSNSDSRNTITPEKLANSKENNDNSDNKEKLTGSVISNNDIATLLGFFILVIIVMSVLFSFLMSF